MNHPKQILHSLRADPKKSLGQNFLFDENVLGRIVQAGDVQAGDEILEIGPGLGHLTKQLLKTGVPITAVELDQRFISHLTDELAGYTNFNLVQADILNVNPDDYFRRPYKVIANVPYYITGAILRHLLSAQIKPQIIVVTIQKEVAERISAKPPNMSLLSATTQFYGEPKLVSVLKAGAFWPRPDVDSAIIRIDLHEKRPLSLGDETSFMRLLKAGFSQKRKQLKNNLKQLGIKGEALTAVFQQANIDPTRRAQTLSLAEWTAIFKAVQTVRQSHE